MLNRVVYIPCELKSRDLESRTMIAASLLKKGVAVVFGQMWDIYDSIGVLPPGCFVFGTANRIQAKNMAFAKKKGHVVVGFDQEALPFSGAGFLDNIDPLAATNSDVFLVATKVHREALRKVYPHLPVEVIGNPRVDMLRSMKPPAPMAEPYILFNTSFALTNSVWGSTDKAVNALLEGGGVTEQAVRERLEFEIASKEETMPLLEWAASNLPWRVVVRPHPAEQVEPWYGIAKDRMTIVAGQSPIPWIANAKVMVHANSTTGFEASILGTPCVNISPLGHDHFVDLYILRAMNPTVRTSQEAIEAILSWMQTGKGLASTFAADAYPPNSAERIAKIAYGYVRKRPLPAEMELLYMERTQAMKTKFTVTPEEMLNCLRTVGSINIDKVNIALAGDSLFLMVP